MLTTFPLCNFSLEFPKILSQNLRCYHWLRVSGNSKIMHCGMLFNMPYWLEGVLYDIFSFVARSLISGCKHGLDNSPTVSSVITSSRVSRRRYVLPIPIPWLTTPAILFLSTAFCLYLLLSLVIHIVLGHDAQFLSWNAIMFLNKFCFQFRQHLYKR